MSTRLLLLLLAGCGASPATAPAAPPPSPAPVVDASCDDARGIACFERRRASCTPASKSWRLGFVLMGNHHDMYVSSLGMIRTETPHTTLYSHDGDTWLACIDGCPPGSRSRACIPYLAETSVSADPPEGCEVEERDGLAWHGHATRLTRWSCPDGRSVTLTAVPALAEVRDALVGVGFIEEGSALATRDGLVVAVAVDDMPQFFEIRAFEAVGCSVWDYPDGYAVYGDAERFARLAEIAGPLRHAVDASLKAQAAELERVVNEALIAEIGRRCLGERPSYTEAEVQACVAERPDLHPEVEALKRTARDKLTQAVMQSGQERARLELSAALCNEMRK